MGREAFGRAGGTVSQIETRNECRKAAEGISGRAPTARAAAPSACRSANEEKLLRRVRERCHAAIAEACRYSSVPTAFLAALVANESGGDAQAMRFEPAVYRHLKSLAAGERPKYAGHHRDALEREIEEMLHPKSPAFHAHFLNAEWTEALANELAACRVEALRELATSWGYTQIMGYHLIGRPGTVQDLLDARFHFHLAIELLAGFAERYQLDLAREFAEMFRCWNTGQPYGETIDPQYVEKGLRRMAMYREIE
jgi:hypothetical protein